MTDIKKINAQMMAIKSEISKNEDTLKDYMLYKQFLDTLTPPVCSILISLLQFTYTPKHYPYMSAAIAGFQSCDTFSVCRSSPNGNTVIGSS